MQDRKNAFKQSRAQPADHTELSSRIEHLARRLACHELRSCKVLEQLRWPCREVFISLLEDRVLSCTKLIGTKVRETNEDRLFIGAVKATRTVIG